MTGFNWKAIILAAAAWSMDVSKVPSSVRGASDDALDDVFFLQFDVNSGVTDCREHVLKHLASKNVDSSRIRFRTEFNSKTYGATCSLQIDGHEGELFGVSRAEIFAVHEVARVKPAMIETPSVESISSTVESIHTMTGAKQARELKGLTGKGVRVAVIDSGVYYKHPALGGGFGPGFKVSYGYDLIGDKYDPEVANPIVLPDPDPIDECSEDAHGTHVAGIIAANATGIAGPDAPAVEFTGAAPDVTIGAYRVFSCKKGGTSTDLIASAMFRAADDKSDIINMSLGGGPVHSDAVTAAAAEQIMKRGHLVVASNGNSGAYGEYTAGAPGISRGSFGVGSVDNAKPTLFTATVAGKNYPLNLGSAFKGTMPDKIDLSDVVLSNPNAEAEDDQKDGTRPLGPEFKGKVVLVRWGSTAFGGSAARCGNVAAAGGSACVLYGHTSIMAGISGTDLIPSFFLDRRAGLQIIEALKAGKKPEAVLLPKTATVVDSATGGSISDFSSHGLDLDLFIKPDIVGIGGNVYSTVNRVAGKGGLYMSMSGTSMSAPNVAGLLALILEHQRNLKISSNFQDLRTLVQNTATPLKRFEKEYLDGVSAQGAGLINVWKAVNAQTKIVPSSFSLNDTVRMASRYEFTVENFGINATSYQISSVNAVTIGPFIDGDDAIQSRGTTMYSSDAATLSFSETSFTLQAGEKKTVSFTVTPPTTSLRLPIYSGYIAIDSTQEEDMFYVPYAGVVGDYSTSPIFTRKSPAFKNYIANAFKLANEGSSGFYGPNLTPLPQKVVPGSAIEVLPIMATNSRNVELTLEALEVDEEKLKAIGLSKSTPLIPILRNKNGQFIRTGTGLTGVLVGYTQRHSYEPNALINPQPFVWTGQVLRSDFRIPTLPAGKYRLKLNGLRHFMDIKNNATVAANPASFFDVII
jgi:subtilisin family serine protease